MFKKNKPLTIINKQIINSKMCIELANNNCIHINPYCS